MKHLPDRLVEYRMRRRKALFGTAIVAIILITVPVLIHYAPRIVPPADGSLVGLDETAVRLRYGSPAAIFAGHYGNPGSNSTARFRGPIRTEVFSIFRGELYVSFENRNGVWTAVCNTVLPRGGSF